jgi:hypothetical protein
MCFWTEYFVTVGNAKVQVLRANLRTSNGVIHIIDHVIFDPYDLRTGQSVTGTGQRLTAPSSLNVATYVVFLLLLRYATIQNLGTILAAGHSDIWWRQTVS